jgi:hypothetical protein
LCVLACVDDVLGVGCQQLFDSCFVVLRSREWVFFLCACSVRVFLLF